MHRREYLLSAVGIIGGTTVGSVAYTSASVDRSVTANVAADSTAIIGLNPSTDIDAVYENSGELTIDTSNGATNDINVDGEFTYGDPNDPLNQFAFTVTNNSGSAKNLTVSLSGMNFPASSNFEIQFYDEAPAQVGIADKNGDLNSYSWSATETLYAVITVDTSGTSDGNSITGPINFSAN